LCARAAMTTLNLEDMHELRMHATANRATARLEQYNAMGAAAVTDETMRTTHKKWSKRKFESFIDGFADVLFQMAEAGEVQKSVYAVDTYELKGSLTARSNAELDHMSPAEQRRVLDLKAAAVWDILDTNDMLPHLRLGRTDNNVSAYGLFINIWFGVNG